MEPIVRARMVLLIKTLLAIMEENGKGKPCKVYVSKETKPN